MSSFTPDQLRELRQLVLTTTTDMQKGRYAGFGNPNHDTYPYADNATPTVPFVMPYVFPSNFQRLIAAKLSIHFDNFRTTATGVATATSSTTAHFHTWVQPGTARTIAFQLGLDAGGNPGLSGVTPPPFGFQTATETGAAGAQGSRFTAIDTTGPGHSHTVTPNLQIGIFQSTTPGNTTIKFDGVDRTTALGGPWSADIVEMDITAYLPTTVSTVHTVTLTPTANGRFVGILHLNYFVDASVPA